MKHFFLSGALILVMISCNKNVEPVTPFSLEGKFQTGNTVYLKPVIMYVQNRQITDTAIINPYLTRHGYSSYFSSASSQTITDTVLVITFENNDSVSYKVKGRPDIFKAKKIQSSSSEWIIQRYDSIALIVFPNSPISNFKRCDTLSYYVNKIAPIIHYVDYVSYGIYYFVPRFPLQILNGELYLPLITMCDNSFWNYPTSTGNCAIGLGDQFNIKKENIENNLFLRDTIVVQEKSIKMNKIQ